MDTPALVALAVVLFVGLPAALRLRPLGIRNGTALALVANYAIVTGTYWATGAALPTEDYLKTAILADIMVMVVILRKMKEGCPPTAGAWGWAKDCWSQQSWWDKAVLWLFLPSWITYAVAMPDVWAFWIAWPAGVLQIIAAGADSASDALEAWRRGRASSETQSPTDPPMSRYGIVASEC